ncbi:efflux transporter outer membrane subunit [Oryzomicrobium sp.]|uniref:efflux transporter outer membrane subunit n=1 Tax=Oryzomicrobium sp. TaxID=1911578 RepID=UPI002600E571|nr:efflux transporter outer membrane subunit [Oryzomicrobium sp.]MCE1244292.1 efflux transporter outer membrane subunit [Oryzomicrobium sp.]
MNRFLSSPRPRPLAAAMALGLAAALGGCAVVSPGQPPLAYSAAGVAQASTQPARPWPQAGWWRGYGDPQLDRLIDAALAGNPSLDAARARVEQARRQADALAGRDSLQVGAQVSAERIKYSENYIFPSYLAQHPQTDSLAALELSWDLDLWGRNREAVAARLGQARAAEAEAHLAALGLSSRVAAVYFDLLAAWQELRLVEARQALVADLSAAAGRRVAAGLSPATERLLRETSQEQEAARRAALATRIQTDRAVLAELCTSGKPEAAGAPPDLNLAPRPLPVADRAGLPADLSAELLLRRPDLAAMEARWEAAVHARASAKADRLPQLSLSGLLGFQTLTFDQLLKGSSGTYGLGPFLTLPVIDGGTRAATVALRDAETDEALATLRQGAAAALREAVSAAASLDGESRQSQALAGAAVRQDEVARRAERRVAAGLDPAPAAWDARYRALQAEQERLAADTRRLAADVALVRALGGGYRQPGEGAPAASSTPSTSSPLSSSADGAERPAALVSPKDNHHG